MKNRQKILAGVAVNVGVTRWAMVELPRDFEFFI